MSAQPHEDDASDRVSLPRTIKAVRAALPEDMRAQFMAELEDADAGGLALVLDTWWTRAVVWNSPKTMGAFASMRAGTWRGIPADEVFAGRRSA